MIVAIKCLLTLIFILICSNLFYFFKDSFKIKHKVKYTFFNISYQKIYKIECIWFTISNFYTLYKIYNYSVKNKLQLFKFSIGNDDTKHDILRNKCKKILEKTIFIENNDYNCGLFGNLSVANGAIGKLLEIKNRNSLIEKSNINFEKIMRDSLEGKFMCYCDNYCEFIKKYIKHLYEKYEKKLIGDKGLVGAAIAILSAIIYCISQFSSPVCIIIGLSLFIIFLIINLLIIKLYKNHQKEYKK